MSKLLLADDSETIHKILKMALQPESYEIRTVLTADEAVKELKGNPPDFFLVDLTLPSKNGYEFSKFVRGDSALKGVRVVLLASAFDPADPDKVANCGADLVIVKPFDPSDLREKLRHLGNIPPKFPANTQVQGSLSGTKVAEEAPPPPPASAATAIAMDTGKESSADDILANLLGVSDASPGAIDGYQPTMQIDLNSIGDYMPTDTVLELSDTTQNSMRLTVHEDLSSPPPPPAAPPAAEDLSSNAQALAAFFDAEINHNQMATASTPPPPPSFAAPSIAPIDDNPVFSLSETLPSDTFQDWGGSSPGLKKAAPEMQTQSKPSSAPPSSHSGPSSPVGASSTMFDVGGSTFQFSSDYIQRITRSFSGDPQEPVPDPNANKTAMFKHTSDDRKKAVAGSIASTPAPSAPTRNGGAWTEDEAKKVEQLVREEVQMMVREVVEKVAWEVIPELAENLIKKELEKVMKELENS